MELLLLLDPAAVSVSQTPGPAELFRRRLQEADSMLDSFDRSCTASGSDSAAVPAVASPSTSISSLHLAQAQLLFLFSSQAALAVMQEEDAHLHHIYSDFHAGCLLITLVRSAAVPNDTEQLRIQWKQQYRETDKQQCNRLLQEVLKKLHYSSDLLTTPGMQRPLLVPVWDEEWQQVKRKTELLEL
jgi:hypothetical protein